MNHDKKEYIAQNESFLSFSWDMIEPILTQPLHPLSEIGGYKIHTFFYIFHKKEWDTFSKSEKYIKITSIFGLNDLQYVFLYKKDDFVSFKLEEYIKL